ncbi:sulfur carrier protein ThiS [Terrarubrum flagellatum]|uniref:sulfur carrier protein ThiS n=1 Tax=Terrirubrum flagellatum TaxID=2895980 RepID=UPI003144F781
MKIRVNDSERELSASTLAEALDALGFRDAVVATAVNGEFVAAAARASTSLAEGDAVEIVAPMQGG